MAEVSITTAIFEGLTQEKKDQLRATLAAEVDREIRRDHLEKAKDALSGSEQFLNDCENGVTEAETRLLLAKANYMKTQRAVELAEQDLELYAS